jgi:Probable cobalt transporter subunit (CbtA)
MDSLSFLVVALISGAIAGTVFGLINLVLVEPYLDKAIGVEVQNSINAGEEVNLEEHVSYRFWQKSGEVAAGTILGMTFGSLLGIVFVFWQKNYFWFQYKESPCIIRNNMASYLYYSNNQISCKSSNSRRS